MSWFVALLAPAASAGVTLDGVAYATIGDALAVAIDGDVLALDPGAYDEHLDLGGLSVTIEGVPTDPGAVTLSWDAAAGEDAVVVVDGGTVVLRGLTITSSINRAARVVSGELVLEDAVLSTTLAPAAAERDGGCVFASGDLTVRDSAFVGCVSPFEGGALWVGGASLIIERTTFLANEARDDGGAIYASNTLTTWSVDDSVFCGNVADVDGGAVLTRSDGLFRNNVFVANVAGAAAPNQGGAVFVINGTSTFENNTFLENEASSGAAVYSSNAPALAPVALRNNAIAGNMGGTAVGWSTVAPSSTYNAFDANTSDYQVAVPATNLVATPPAFFLWSVDGDCGNDVLALLPSSDLINAGDPATQDPDATRADIGAGGGPSSEGFVDLDADGLLAVYECDDADAASYPGAVEACDLADNDCDGEVDEGGFELGIWFMDADGDGSGDASSPTEPSCMPPAGASADGQDCDDGDPSVYPLAEETCDLVDQNCDGDPTLGAVDAAVWWADGDGDGVGGDVSLASCDVPVGYVAGTGDCDDAQPAVAPGLAEVCFDGLDNDCLDGADGPDAIDASAWYADADGDGFGDSAAGVVACEPPEGHVSEGGDCAPVDPGASPGVAEVCDGDDQDCDGVSDEGLPVVTLYVDDDGDGHGDPARPAETCLTEAVGFAPVGDDCDDAEALVWPGNPEVCDGLDNDCDGTPDQPDAEGATTWYADGDGDGRGDRGAAFVACEQPAGHVAEAGDCDDEDPDRTEDCPEGCGGCDGSGGSGGAGAFVAIAALAARRRRR